MLGEARTGRLVRVVSRQQRGLLQEKTTADCLLPLPSLVSPAQTRLQLQADTNGALIATGNLSGGGSWASRRRWGPGCTPFSWPPTQSQPSSCPAPHIPALGPIPHSHLSIPPLF